MVRFFDVLLTKMAVKNSDALRELQAATLKDSQSVVASNYVLKPVDFTILSAKKSMPFFLGNTPF